MLETAISRTEREALEAHEVRRAMETATLKAREDKRKRKPKNAKTRKAKRRKLRPAYYFLTALLNTDHSRSIGCLNHGELRFAQLYLVERLKELEVSGLSLRGRLKELCRSKCGDDDLWFALQEFMTDPATTRPTGLTKLSMCVRPVLRELKEFRSLEQETQALLKEFAFSPSFFFDLQHEAWGATDSRSEDGRLHQALSELQALIQSGRLRRLRRCVNHECGRWFVARVEGQSCCATRCRKKVESAQPEARTRHAQASREYRKRNSSRRAFMKGR